MSQPTSNNAASAVNHDLVRHLNRAWPKRATVCAVDRFQIEDEFDPARPDYPLSMVPFHDDPRFAQLDAATRSAILTWGWIGYNQRTVTAEESVVNPALSVIANQYLGEDDWHFREAMQQTLIDEHYHTLMHLRAIERARAERQIDYTLTLPRSVTYRRLQEVQQGLNEPWQRDLAAIAFAVVAEISVNAYLDTLAQDQSIQPQNRRVAELHNRDEYAHSKVLAEIGKVMFANMATERRAFFAQMLPVALHAFVAQDYSMWEAILLHLQVPDAAAIIADAQTRNRGGVIMRDYTGLHRLAADIGILDQMNFDFTGTLRPSAEAMTEAA
ncbi:diiron oxygenase [Amantichitinum ursilacus]|uniref:p-aminobenzoate N-oxygenase AurF n=1 Tax=Amantichitinum ursilacus TaxID=857265 RepID=A0A0N0GNP4_9NEIS|nr:diiron oxygenase [Amantichitinum ursilacus]KPC52723.1 P-aminobenzoate N-oxygenase AurF [Amantichitinum ursilacus]